jgi:hypothetical protein
MDHIFMICHYCNKQTDYPEDEYHNHCSTCNVDYLNTEFRNDSKVAVNLNAEINGKKYTLQLRPYHPTAPARIICDFETINLSTIPNVTPQNIKEKLKLYLTFL